MSWNCPLQMMPFSFSKSYRLLSITPDYHRDRLCESRSLARTRMRVEDPEFIGGGVGAGGEKTSATRLCINIISMESVSHPIHLAFLANPTAYREVSNQG